MNENENLESQNDIENVSNDVEESESQTEETSDVSGNSQINDGSGNTTVYITNDVDLSEVLREIRTLHATDTAILNSLSENLPVQVLKPSVIYGSVFILGVLMFLFGRKN